MSGSKQKGDIPSPFPLDQLASDLVSGLALSFIPLTQKGNAPKEAPSLLHPLILLSPPLRTQGREEKRG